MLMRTILGLGCAFLIASCSLNQPRLSFRPPVAQQSITLSSASASSLETVADRLRSAGFQNVAVNRRSGIVSATTTSPAYLDCGKIRQSKLGNSATFEGNSEYSVLYRDDESLDFVSREVSVRSRFEISLNADMIGVAENHQVTLEWRAPDTTLLASQKRRVVRGELTKFSDGTSCTPNNALAQVLG